MSCRARIILFCLAFLPLVATARPLPEQPTELAHPGSSAYANDSVHEIAIPFEDREGTLYLPMNKGQIVAPLATLAYGHGFGTPEFTMHETFVHLARKGIAVLYVPYESSGRRDFGKMALDYNRFVAQAVHQFQNLLDPKKVVFCGHSDGASVAVMAAGLPPTNDLIAPAGILAFAISRNAPEYYQRLNPHTPCTFVVGESDTENPPEFTQKLFSEARCRKQMIVLRSYIDGFDEELLATHSSIRNLGWTGNQTSALHYFGYWKFMVGTALDVASGGKGTNSWIFGPGAEDTGDETLRNLISR